MRANDFGFDMSILEDISDENKVIIDLADIKINYEEIYFELLSDLTDYIENYDVMSSETKVFIKRLIKAKYLEYRKDAIKLLRNSQIDPANDIELQDIFDIENSRFNVINDLVKNSKIMK